MSTLFDLIPSVWKLLESCKGITNLYSWQHECLNLDAVQARNNLLYSLPTSGGKTLIAEILILKEVLLHKKNALFVLPYVSIVQEKVRSLSEFAITLGFAIEEYAGSRGKLPPKKQKKQNVVYMATIEKASTLLMSLIEESRENEIGLVVIDEVHMVSDEGGRGALLETLIAKVQYIDLNIQIIGMSATIGNLLEVSRFMNAETYTNDFRPTELKEYVKMGSNVFEIDLSDGAFFHSPRPVRMKYNDDMKKIDPDHVGGLVAEVVPSQSCLIFCATKKNCENVATMILQFLSADLLHHKKEEKNLLLLMLGQETNGQVCPVLRQSIPFGICYHHSGLTTDERNLLEESYLNEVLCCICCTSTLAAGVNLPAKRVILRSPYMGTDFLSRNMYLQMIGRAGRAGFERSGESILVCNDKDMKRLKTMLVSAPNVCVSRLMDDEGYALKHAILSLIATHKVHCVKHIEQFIEHTLYYTQNKEQLLKYSHNLILNMLTELKRDGFLRIQQDSDLLKATKLGVASIKGGVDLIIVARLFDDLMISGNGLVVNSSLHFLYLVTPYTFISLIDIQPRLLYLSYISLTKEQQCVVSFLGINESVIMSCLKGRMLKTVDLSVVKRVYLALMLEKLWKQKSIWDVAEHFEVSRGFVQNLLTCAAGFACCIQRFCQELDEMWAYQSLLGVFSKQLFYCCTPELLELMQLPYVNRSRAVQFYNAGYKTWKDIGNAHANDIIYKIAHIRRKVANHIIVAAKLLVIQENQEDGGDCDVN